MSSRLLPSTVLMVVFIAALLSISPNLLAINISHLTLRTPSQQSTHTNRNSAPSRAPIQGMTRHQDDSANYFNSKFYVNMTFSSSPVNWTTMDRGSTSRVDFIVDPAILISNAALHISMPNVLLASTGQKDFSGELPANVTRDLSFTVQPLYETYADVDVNATGDIQVGGGPQFVTQMFYLTVNTTGWPALTQAFSRDDPYRNNSTRIPMIDFNRTRPNMLTPPELMTAVASKATPGDNVVVDGTLLFFDDGAINGMAVSRPLVGITVHLQDDGCIAGCTDMKTTTDSNGFFSFNAAGPIPSNPHLYVVPDTPEENICHQCGIFMNCGYDLDMGRAGSNVPNPSTIHLGNVAPQGFNELLWVWDAIQKGILKVQSYSFDPFWQTKATYPTGNWPNTSYGGLDNYINVPAEANCQPSANCWTHVAIQHEFGHVIQFKLTGGGPFSSCCSGASHRLLSEYDGGFAITEGWADFMAAWVDFNPNINGIQTCCNYNKNAMTTQNGGNGADLGDRDGNNVEGSAMSIFWELFDGPLGQAETFPCPDPNGVAPQNGETCGGFENIFLNFNILNALVTITGPGGNNGASGGIFPDKKPNDMVQFFTAFINKVPNTKLPMCQIYSEFGIDLAACVGLQAPAITGSGLVITVIASLLVSSIPVARRKSRLHVSR